MTKSHSRSFNNKLNQGWANCGPSRFFVARPAKASIKEFKNKIP